MFSSYVVSSSGEKLTFKKALIRNFSVFVNGLGLMIPIISFITLWNSYNKLKNIDFMGLTLWDMQTNSVVVTRKLKPIRIILCCIIAFSILFSLSYLENYYDESSAVINQLNIEKENLDLEYDKLEELEDELTIKNNKVIEMYDKMEQWEAEGNSEDYNYYLDEYNDIYYSLQEELESYETRRLKYNRDSEAYNKRYSEVME